MERLSESMIEEHKGQVTGASSRTTYVVTARSAISRCSSQSEMLLS